MIQANIYELVLLGPGPGELKVKLSRNSLYRSAHIIYSDKETLCSDDYVPGQLIYLPITDEQWEWLASLQLERLSTLFYSEQDVVADINI